MCQYCEKLIAIPAKTKASQYVPIKSSYIISKKDNDDAKIFIRAKDKWGKLYYQASFTIQYCPLCGERI